MKISWFRPSFIERKFVVAASIFSGVALATIIEVQKASAVNLVIKRIIYSLVIILWVKAPRDVNIARAEICLSELYNITRHYQFSFLEQL